MAETATHLCVALQISSSVQSSMVQSAEVQSWGGRCYNTTGEKYPSDKNQCYMGHPLPSSLSPSTSLLTCCLDRHKFPEVPARCLKTEGKPKQNKPDVAGCFNLQEEPSSSRLVPS